ncbi:unnamed protein product [Auanema sp. JU1783]|nr:unnamed protein product [Auanema sp. JU1783]
MLALDVPSEMIVFPNSLENWFDKTTKIHCQQEKEKGILTSVYFLIGSFCSDGDIHVAYPAKCPLPESAKDSEGDSLSKSFDDVWLSDCAEKITRILPGGVNIVGIAWFSNRNVFADKKPMIIRAIARIQRTNNSLTMLNLGNVHDYMGLVHVETPFAKAQAIVVDVIKRNPESPTKISFSALEWISVVTNASARVNLNIPMKGKHYHFYNEFAAAVRPFAENLLSCDTILVDGALREGTEPLFKDLKKKKSSAVEVQLFIDPCYDKKNACEAEKATNLLEITFDIEIRGAIPLRSNVEAVKTAAKHHLIRSLMSRAELQFESMEVVEESSNNQECSVHQLPRPATTLLPCNGSVLISDYLFEADTVEDAQKNFEELLELKTNIEHVDDGWERALLPEEMASVKSPLDGSPVVSYKVSEDDISAGPFFIVLAVIVAIIAIIVYFAMRT